jgi:hypothetical protein
MVVRVLALLRDESLVRLIAGLWCLVIFTTASACHTATTAKVAAQVPGPRPDPGCLTKLDQMTFGSEAVRHPLEQGSPKPRLYLHLVVNLCPKGKGHCFANVIAESNSDGKVTVAVESVWLGTAVPESLVYKTQEQEAAFLRSMLRTCTSSSIASNIPIECRRSRGRRSESGCGSK